MKKFIGIVITVVIFIGIAGFMSTTDDSKSNNIKAAIKEEPTQTDYNNIENAINSYNEAKETEKKFNGDEFSNVNKREYSEVIRSLDLVKTIPNEYAEQVTSIRKDSEEKVTHYTSISEKQEAINKKNNFKADADNRTLNPLPVKIGMTREEVLTEGWGRPKEINKTTTGNYVSEQWVYKNYNYLYFDNGILTTIQN